MNVLSRFLILSALVLVSLLLPATNASAENPADFTLTAATGEKGKEFTLSKARGHYVALHFLLKTECPFCIKHTRSYVENADKAAGVQHIFIKPDSDEEIIKWAGKIDPKTLPEVYRDADAKLADQFAIPGGYSFHNQSVHYPALVILDPAGREVFRYIGKSNTDRYTFDQFAAKMSELTKSKEVGQYNLEKDKSAIDGYDPVAYMKTNSATKGSEEITSTYRGVKYNFATAENRALFAKEPEKYLPAYGGWCATAMAKGDKVEIEPDNFKVTNGRTFLFYKGLLGDAKKDWVKDEPAETKKADAQWSKIAAK